MIPSLNAAQIPQKASLGIFPLLGRRFFVIGLILASLFSANLALADYQHTLDDCITAWGKKSPFKKGTPANKTVSAGVKVFGIGKSNVGDEDVTKEPALVLIKPAVNVLGKSTIHLGNPNGWYCFKSNVTVLGKLSIEADCKAHIASASDDSAEVLASDDSEQGVAVLGSLRISRFNCEKEKKTE